MFTLCFMYFIKIVVLLTFSKAPTAASNCAHDAEVKKKRNRVMADDLKKEKQPVRDQRVGVRHMGQR